MKKLFSALISMGLLIALATSAFATNQTVGNSEVGNSKLLEKIGFTKEELIDLKANPDKVDINFEKPEKGIKKKIKKKDVLRLAQLGFTKQEISDMNQEEFDSLKDKTGTLIEVDTKYIKIEDGVTTEVPEKEALIEYKKLKDKEKKKQNGDVSIQAEIGTDVENTSWMQLLTTVSTVSTGVWQVKNSFNWWTEPVWTLEDAIGISHPEYQTPDMNSELFTYTYDRHTNNTNLTYVSTGTKTKYTADDKNSNGMAFKYDIIESEYVNGTKYLVLNHRGKMYYDFRKASSQYTRGAVYGHYTHTEMGIVGSIGVKISLNSLSVSGAAKQTKMTDTGVSFSF